MALSNTGGAGRGSNDGDIIGSVIAHGKKAYWSRARSHHYHCTLEKGPRLSSCLKSMGFTCLLGVLLQKYSCFQAPRHVSGDEIR